MTMLFRSTLVAMAAMPFLLTGCQCSQQPSEEPTAPVEAPAMDEAAPTGGDETLPPAEEMPPMDDSESAD